MKADPFGFIAAIGNTGLTGHRAVMELPNGDLGISAEYPMPTLKLWIEEAESHGHKLYQIITEQEYANLFTA